MVYLPQELPESFGGKSWHTVQRLGGRLNMAESLGPWVYFPSRGLSLHP